MDLQTRNQYMKAMGIPVWMPNVSDDEMGTDIAQAAQNQANPISVAVDLDSDSAQNADLQHAPVQAQAPENIPSPASSAATAVVNAAPVQRMPLPANNKPQPTPDIPAIAPDCSGMGWAQLQEGVTNCQLCGLHRSRTQTVFGSGDREASWMIIGEAPGADEDRQGEPFVGKSGQLLNNMLAAAGLPRNAVYISNVLKCRPPNNRDPKPDEAALCRGYLERQIALVQPTLIIVVGRIAAHNLLHVTTPLGRLRGTVHQLPGTEIPVIVTYHPAYLLRQLSEKPKAWQDLQLARQVMANRERTD